MRTPTGIHAHAAEIIPSSYFTWSHWASQALAAVLLIPALPVILVAMVIVRLTSPGPGIFRQTRVGLHGHHFTMYKLRTMGVDAEARSGAVWCQENDPRVTRFGALLRRLHIDEFPQLFNVLKGEMSLVGPRPERPEFTQRLGVTVPGYLKRLAVLPGITGLAQLNLPPDTDIDSVRRKLVLDLEYIATGSFWLDVCLIFCTALRIPKFPVISLCGLQRDVRLSQDDFPCGSSRVSSHPVVVPCGVAVPALLPESDHRGNGHSHQPVKPK
jgi:lipopolysaccharide/colanic/teichoic acid biosynthesis glycosyltransferase